MLLEKVKCQKKETSWTLFDFLNDSKYISNLLSNY